MTTEELIETLKSKKRNPGIKTYWLVCVFLLGRRRFPIQHIANAFKVNYYTVQYGQNKAKDLLDVKDKYAVEALDELKNHAIDLVPYYTIKKKINTYVKIDNIKL